ncbi:hypothetical protein [Sphingomonas segetis]|uniref:hypothetical protein n=1 Tax=Sphingomonas segetis TaxID=1104779 RepID=UPI0012D306B1|nr:hypothetical protein [Sphingomonas segetis]
MAVYKELLAKRVKGSLMENEDWWYLCYDTESQRYYVEHEWDHMNPYKIGSGDHGNGTTQSDAEGWTGVGADKIEEAKAKLKAAVASAE